MADLVTHKGELQAGEHTAAAFESANEPAMSAGESRRKLDAAGGNAAGS